MVQTPLKGGSNVPSTAAAADWLQFVSVVMLGVVSYFLKRSMGTIDDLEKRVATMETRVAILLDRDRRRRLEDYEREGDYSG